MYSRMIALRDTALKDRLSRSLRSPGSHAVLRDTAWMRTCSHVSATKVRVRLPSVVMVLFTVCSHRCTVLAGIQTSGAACAPRMHVLLHHDLG